MIGIGKEAEMNFSTHFDERPEFGLAKTAIRMQFSRPPSPEAYRTWNVNVQEPPTIGRTGSGSWKKWITFADTCHSMHPVQ